MKDYGYCFQQSQQNLKKRSEAFIMFKGKKEEQPVSKTETIGTLIGQGTVFKGTLTTKETVRIDGLIKGEIHSEEHLIIGETGRIEGNITSQSVLNAGYIHGNVTIDERLEITSTGVIIGDIVTNALIVEEGASFKGNCQMQSMISKKDETAAEEAAGKDKDVEEMSADVEKEK